MLHYMEEEEEEKKKRSVFVNSLVYFGQMKFIAFLWGNFSLWARKPFFEIFVFILRVCHLMCVCSPVGCAYVTCHSCE